MFCVGNIYITALEKLPQFAQDWIQTVKLSEVDVTDIQAVYVVPATDDETYRAVLADNSEIFATRIKFNRRIQCVRNRSDSSFVLLEDRYFDLLKHMYIASSIKK
jgi:hypothetical protein